MKQPHLAVFTEMGNGHVYPILPLCSELATRGYRITFATNEHFARHVRKAGAEPILFADTPVDSALRAENEQRFRHAATDLARFELSDLEWSYLVKSSGDFLAQTLSAYERDPPDLVLYNRYCIPGRIIANRLGAPAVQLSPHFAYHGRSRFWDRGVAKSPVELASYAARLDDLLAAHGLSAPDNLWHIEQLNIHFVPREFQYQSESFDDSFVFAGSLHHRHSRFEWIRPLTAGPLVLISGYSGLPATQVSNQRYFETFIEALAGLPCQCILSIGNRLDPRDLGALPANFAINQTTPHLQILPHTDLFACHGGMGSTLEALYNGVPVLAAPSTPYTEEVAYRIAELEVGEVLSQPDFGVAAVKRCVSKMLSDQPLRDRAKQLQERFQQAGGSTATADRIEQFLRALN